MFAATLAFSILNLQTPSTIEQSEYAKFADRWQSAAKGMGAASYSVVVVRGEKVVLLDSRGFRDIGQSQPATPDTTYYIASITKTYIAMAISRLEAEGKLSVKDPITKYLPWFKLSKSDFKGPVTIEDLLCHRPGINCSQAVLLDAYTGEITDKRYQHWLATTGTALDKTAYSNIHFTLLGRIIERITGKSWQDALDEIVFKPLRLTDTSAYASVMFGRENSAVPMVKAGDRFEYARPLKSDATMHAAGGIGTTARDFSKYLLALLNPGMSGNPLTQSLVDGLFTPLSSIPKNGSIRIRTGFGRAWNTGSYRNLTPLVSHGGGYTGASSMIAILPEKHLAFGLLVNGPTPASGLEAILMLDIFDQELGLKDKQDLLPAYLDEASKFFKRTEAPVPNLVLQKPIIPHPEQLIGKFVSPDLGTLTFEYVDGLIVGRLGQFVFDLKAEGGAYTIVGEEKGTNIKPVLKDGNLRGMILTYYGRSEPFVRSR